MNTDGKEVKIKDKNLSGKEREQAVLEATEEKPRPKPKPKAAVGAGPSKASQALGPDGSAPGRVRGPQ